MKMPIIFVLLLLTISCNDEKNADTNVCSETTPIDEIPWIEDLKNSLSNCTCEISIIKGTYDGQTVIFTAHTDPRCNSVETPTLYNCDGEKIRSFTDSVADQKELSDKVTHDRVLYTCKD